MASGRRRRAAMEMMVQHLRLKVVLQGGHGDDAEDGARGEDAEDPLPAYYFLEPGY